MRDLFLAAAAVAAAVSIGAISTPAQARDYAFCIKGGDYDSAIGYCSFDTYQQCLATASGRRAYCDANPFFASEKNQRIASPHVQHRQY
jgi:hypothetical protein